MENESLHHNSDKSPQKQSQDNQQKSATPQNSAHKINLKIGDSLSMAPYQVVIPKSSTSNEKAVYRELNWFSEVLFYRYKHLNSHTSLWNLEEGDNEDQIKIKVPKILKSSNDYHDSILMSCV